ncbi:MAG: hypothetical protein Q4B91_03415 [Atopobiaceae bacterium]|nr:hypothetical protein [Atopobiaceae bacterium]
MTGTERLRELVEGVRPHLLGKDVVTCDYADGHEAECCASFWKLLLAIADQIAREHAEDCFKMGHVLGEDAEAASWVREHGGIEGLRLMLQDADSRRVELCAALGIDLDKEFRVDGDGTKHTGSVLPVNLTHRAPVLAADGRPLREGETVWATEDSPFSAPLERGDEVTVRHVSPYSISVEDEAGVSWAVGSHHLTHERPDSWGRLEEDVTLSVERYCDRCELKKHGGMTWPQLVREDLVRRARALAGDT